MKYICSHCHCEENITTRHAKCACGGLWQLDYRPPAFTADGIDRAEWSQFRYHRYMALNGDAWTTSCRPYPSKTGARLSSSLTAAEVGGDYCHDRVIVVHVLKEVRAEVRDHNDDDTGRIMYTL